MWSFFRGDETQHPAACEPPHPPLWDLGTKVLPLPCRVSCSPPQSSSTPATRCPCSGPAPTHTITSHLICLARPSRVKRQMPRSRSSSRIYASHLGRGQRQKEKKTQGELWTPTVSHLEGQRDMGELSPPYDHDSPPCHPLVLSHIFLPTVSPLYLSLLQLPAFSSPSPSVLSHHSCLLPCPC